MINGFIFFSESTFAIPLRLIYFRSNIIGPYGVVLCCCLKKFSFSLKVSIFVARSRSSWVKFRRFVVWNTNTLVFLPISVPLLFLFYFSLCYQSCYWLPFLVYLGSFKCSLFRVFIINFLVVWSICLSSFLVYFKNGFEYLTMGTVQVFDEISAAELGFKKFSRSSKVLFYFFLSSPLVWWCPLPIFPSICNFPFLKVFWFFLELTVLFLPLFVFFLSSLLAWHIFLCQISFQYFGRIFLLFV